MHQQPLTQKKRYSIYRHMSNETKPLVLSLASGNMHPYFYSYHVLIIFIHMYARFLLSCSSMLSRTRSGFELLRIMILTAVQTEMFSYFCTTLSIADNRIFLCPSVVLISQLIEWHSNCFYLYCGIFYYASETLM